MSNARIEATLNIQQASSSLDAELREEEAQYDKVKEELKHLKLLYSQTEIDQAIEKLAHQITKDLHDNKHLVLITLLEGATYFAANLKTQLFKAGLLYKEDSLGITRYGSETTGSKIPKIYAEPKHKDKLEGRTVLIIEDLAEGGITLQAAIKYFESQKAAKILVATLTDKFKMRDESSKNFKPDYNCFSLAENKWLIGFGCDQKYYARALPGLWYKEPTAAPQEPSLPTQSAQLSLIK
jgi:hypoxanthine phosphoribosyltransferase